MADWIRPDWIRPMPDPACPASSPSRDVGIARVGDPRDVPILFSGPMVRAILDGRKTKTRRILKDAPSGDGWHCDRAATGLRWVASAGSPSMPVRLRWAVGDRLWVRETWKPHSSFAGTKPSLIPQSRVFYAADRKYAPSNTPWVPSIFMPRWASRITLGVVDVRIERLQAITEADALAEGMYWSETFEGYTSGAGADESCDFHLTDPTKCFLKLWVAINGDGSWNADPWVSVTTFRRIVNAPAIGGCSGG